MTEIVTAFASGPFTVTFDGGIVAARLGIGLSQPETRWMMKGASTASPERVDVQ